MAKIILGAFITQIAGSIGGTTFRNYRGRVIVQNKSMGGSRSRLLDNLGLLSLKASRNAWMLFDDTAKDSWNALAATIKFPDRFGNDQTITGRQLFIKADSVLRQQGSVASDVASFSKNLIDFSITSATMVSATTTTQVYISMDAFIQWYYLSAEIINNSTTVPVFNRRETLFTDFLIGDGTLTDVSKVFAKFPYLVAGQIVRLYVTPVNTYGYKGTPQFIDVTVT